MFRFRFLAGDAVAAVLTYSSSSSTALLSYQPGAKVPARGKVRRGLTRSSATLAFDSWMCIIGPYGRHETCRKACGRRLPAEALKTRRWHIEGWRTSAGGVLPPPRRRALDSSHMYIWTVLDSLMLPTMSCSVRDAGTRACMHGRASRDRAGWMKSSTVQHSRARSLQRTRELPGHSPVCDCKAPSLRLAP